MSIETTISNTIDSFADSQFNFASEHARKIVTKEIMYNLIAEQYEPARTDIPVKQNNLVIIDKDDLDLLISIKNQLPNILSK